MPWSGVGSALALCARVDDAAGACYITNQSVINAMSAKSSTPSPAADESPRRERRKEARPGELLDAALDLFVEKGYAATKVDEVAARAGVSKGTLFLYFPSKEDLFKAVVRESIAGRFAEWDMEVEAFTGSSSELVRCCLQEWWDRIGSTRASGITKLMLYEAQNFPEIARFYQEEVVEPGNRLIRRALQRGVDRGEFEVADLDYAIYPVLAPLVFLALSRHSQGMCVDGSQPIAPDRYLDAVADTLLRGLCVRSAADPAPPRIVGLSSSS